MQLTSRCHGAAGTGHRQAITVVGGLLPLGVLLACAVLSAGPSPAPAADRAPSPLAKQLFASYCIQCHGADGKGGLGRAGAGTPGAVAMPEIPDFTNRPWQLTRTNVQLAVSILEGKNQHMPANRGMVNDDLARELVGIVRAFAPAPAPAVTKAAPAPAPAPAPPRVASGPAGTPAAPAEVASLAAYTPTGDFDADFDHYLGNLETLQRQVRALASAPAAVSPSPGNPPAAAAPPAAAPPTAAPPAAEPPAAGPPEAAPPVSAPPANQVVYLPERPPAATDKPPAAGTSPQPLQFLLAGLGGAVLGLAVLSALWGAFTRRRTPAVPDGQVASTVSPGRPNFSPAPMDCVGAGL